MSVVLDTNALIWLLNDSDRLGRKAARRIDDALRSTKVLISASSFWEIAILVTKNRLALSQPIDQWRVEVLQLGIEEIPIDGELAIASVLLADLHADPADRLIVATALRTAAALVTSDERLLTWQGPLACIDARV